MNEMVERVAGAIYTANFPGFQKWKDALEDWKYFQSSNPKAAADGNDPVGKSLIAARAAIKAMREPTEAMLRSIDLVETDGGGDGPFIINWQAMIDAALA